LRTFLSIACAFLAGALVACSDGASTSRETSDAGAARLVRSGEIPCGPREVLARVCQQCHSDPPQNGAPFSQQTYAEIDKDLDGQPVYRRMKRAVEGDRMPLSPYALTLDERNTLLDWLSDDAPPAPLGTVCP
jgi:uncharacterized membrane protein